MGIVAPAAAQNDGMYALRVAVYFSRCVIYATSFPICLSKILRECFVLSNFMFVYVCVLVVFIRDLFWRWLLAICYFTVFIVFLWTTLSKTEHQWKEFIAEAADWILLEQIAALAYRWGPHVITTVRGTLSFHTIEACQRRQQQPNDAAQDEGDDVNLLHGHNQ